MKKYITIIIISVLFIGSAYNSYALNFGSNITIYDQNSSTSNSWYGIQEDNEVEPGCVIDQRWDLEAFLLKGSQLTMVGGFDFKNGYGGYPSGDIFLDIDGDAVFGDVHRSSNKIETVPNTFGYDYVLDLNFSNFSYSVYSINSSATVNTTYFGINQGSNPWEYVAGGNLIGTGIITYHSGLTNGDVGFSGYNGINTHYAATVDISFLGANPSFISHFTMECGNDNLMGVVPEPGTLLLFGFGVFGVGIIHLIRKIRHN